MTQGQRVRELRKSLDLTLEKFGKKLGVGKTAISKIEHQERNLTEQMLLSICREFNVNEEIYIPLCFYLYSTELQAVSGLSHLHSTMLLLIPVHFSLLIYIISYFLNCRPPFFAFPLSFFSSSIF